MAKQRKRQREKLAAPTSEYRDADGNVLVLRGSLTPGARREYAEILTGGLEREDAWQRATEVLFERLAVSWTISGLDIRDLDRSGRLYILPRYGADNARCVGEANRRVGTVVQCDDYRAATHRLHRADCLGRRRLRHNLNRPDANNQCEIEAGR